MRATATRIKDAISRTGRPSSTTVYSTKAPAISTISTSAANTHISVFHGAMVSKAPDKTIASDGPSVVIAAMIPMFIPSLCRGDTASVIFIPIGVSKPVPMACSSRPPSNVAKFGANAPIMEPTTMMPVTEINSALVGKRRYKTFATGTKIAATKR